MTASTDCSLGTVFYQFWLTLALVGIPGVLGGLTNGISIFLKPADTEAGKRPKTSYYLAFGITGFGGSLAALLVILLDGKLPIPITDLKNLLIIVCTGYVSGYIANKLLPAIAESLNKKLIQLTEQQAELAKKSEQDIGNAVSLSTELTRAKDYLASRTFITGQTEKLIASLSDLAKVYPTNRTLNILLSRTWAEASKNREKALEVLDNFISAKLKADESDEDLAAAYWNAANYYEFDFKKTKNPELRAKALEALRKALEISASYKEELDRDKDFKDLRESPEGKRLLDEFGSKE
jgi:hypothetical protein